MPKTSHPGRSSGLSLCLILVASLLSASCSIRPTVSAQAARGRADVSTGVDFDRGELARLDGVWEFYEGKLLSPEDFGSGMKPAPNYVRVPSMWAKAEGFRQAGEDPVTGVATLRLRVEVPAERREWAIRLPNAYSATSLFVNGIRVADLGTVSYLSAFYSPSSALALPVFNSEGGKLDIVMQVANYSAPMIGTWDSPLLGDAAAILKKRQDDVAVTALISGALLIMGLYHLGLFVLRKKDRSSLIFGIICLLMTTRNYMMGERLFYDLIPPTAASWEWAFKLQLLSAHLALALFAPFLLRLFPRHVRRLPVMAIMIGAAAWAAFVILTPPMIHQRFLHWYEYALLAGGVYLIAAVVRATVLGERGAAIVLGGLVVLMGSSINDVLLSVGLISGTFYMASYGLCLYLFTQSFHLSMIFSKAFTEVEELSARLLQKNDELESLHTIDLAIASSMELDKVLDIVLEQALARLGMDAADVLLLDAESGNLTLGARAGFRSDALLHTRLKPGEGFAGRALQSEKAIIASDLDTNAEGFGRSPAFETEGFFFYAGRRLKVKGKVKGVLELYRRSPFRRYESWDLYFETLAGQAAVALDNSFLLRGLKVANDELKEANEGIIEGWAEALELRDRETEGHSRRVTSMTMELAASFGIGGEELDLLRRGALLHDIGKMGIPDSILLKPGPLSEEEFEVMKRHTTIARNLLSRFRFLDQSLDIPYCHHEKWDGSGYPQGLSGTGIPLSARLFAVIDVWDALRSDRPYRQGWPEEKALEHIASSSGSHFDPEAARVFIELRRAKGRA
jgi:putative nucleotidyltransferase with HDIG domain